MEKINIKNVEDILQLACQLGLNKIRSGDAPTYTDSIVSEKFLVGLLKDAARSLGINPEWIKHHGGHSFPDVSINFSKIGIELKGSNSNRKFNGNSVVASTMIADLKKIYLFYWIGSSGEVGFRDYFECVATPVVTHSPRFQLDVDLQPKESMFGTAFGKAGEVDKLIFGSNGIDSGRIIKWMTDNAKARGESPWWFPSDDSQPSGSTGLIKCTNLPPNKRRAFMKSAFLAFPKIFDKTSPNKYNGLFEWAIIAKSVLSSRDDYSAGGKVKISLPKYSQFKIELPQVIQVAIESLSVSDLIYVSELENPHSKKFSDAQMFISHYKKILPQYLEHMYWDVRGLDNNNVGPHKFSIILSDMLVEKIKADTIII